MAYWRSTWWTSWKVDFVECIATDIVANLVTIKVQAHTFTAHAIDKLSIASDQSAFQNALNRRDVTDGEQC
jgi:hypothetical protein